MRRLLLLAGVLVSVLSAEAATRLRAAAILTSGPEGDAGTRVLIITLNQTPQNFAVNYTYRTIDGTATAADGDFTPITNGSVTIDAGGTTAEIPVEVHGDRKVEADESFTVLVEGPNLADGEFIFTILNDDVAALGTISSATANEGNAGTTSMLFDVTLNAAAAVPVNATFFTTPGTATAGEDYQPAQGTITFAPNTTRQTITVLVNGDTTFEPDETFIVSVALPNQSPLTATGTIVNDDTPPPASLSIISGNNQQAILGQPLAQPLVVEVRNSRGGPAAGVLVQWTVTRGSAQLGPTTGTTNAEGRASITVTPTSTGEIEITATVAGLSTVRFTLNATTSFESRASGPVAVPIARVLDRICARNDAQFGPVCTALAGLSGERITPVLERVAPQQSGAQMKIATEVVSMVTASVTSRLAAVRAGTDSSLGNLTLNHEGKTIPLGAVASTLFGGAAGDEDDTYNGWSAFLSGNLGDGEREGGNGTLGFDLTSRGVTAGVDRLVGTSSIVGASVNWLSLESQLDENTGSVDTRGYTLTVYASRGGLFANDTAGTGRGTRFDGVHLDGSITAGRNTYETEHIVDLERFTISRATAENDASVFAVSAGGGIDLHRGRTDFDVSLLGTWSRADIDDLAEQGNGPLILFVQGHEVESLTGTLGLNVRSAFPVPFGTLLPNLRAEFVREFEDGARFVTARFARDSDLANSFTIPLDTPDANYGRIGAGVQADFAFGWSAFLEYAQDFGRDDLDYRNLQFLIRKSF